MEMHQIRYFLAVAETLNFTRAAENCHVAKPSLSRAVKKLEEELGGDLFRRERGSTHLTELGRSMLPFLTQSYESAIAAKEQAASYGKKEFAPLRIGLSLSVALELVMPMICELVRAFPGLALQLVRGEAKEVLDILKAGEVELVIAADTNPDWERFDVWPLFDEGFGVIVPRSHRMSAQKKIRLEDFVENALVGRRYCEALAVLQAALTERSISPEICHQAANDTDAVALVASGLGIAVMPESAGRTADVTILPIEDFDAHRTVQVYGVAGRQRSAAVNGILRLLRAADWTAQRI
ncbi:MAG: LysR family transcriptional regulator [Proteobacteria bacterium]|nr:LysR family transcriptional regulator [Pseudomonadota bacterium]